MAIIRGLGQLGNGTAFGHAEVWRRATSAMSESGPIFDASRLGMVANREGWILSEDCASEGQGVDRRLESLGRRLKRTRGGHRQSVDPRFGLVVTAVGDPNQECPPSTLKAILRTIDLSSQGEEV